MILAACCWCCAELMCEKAENLILSPRIVSRRPPAIGFRLRPFDSKGFSRKLSSSEAVLGRAFQSVL